MCRAILLRGLCAHSGVMEEDMRREETRYLITLWDSWYNSCWLVTQSDPLPPFGKRVSAYTCLLRLDIDSTWSPLIACQRMGRAWLTSHNTQNRIRRFTTLNTSLHKMFGILWIKRMAGVLCSSRRTPDVGTLDTVDYHIPSRMPTLRVEETLFSASLWIVNSQNWNLNRTPKGMVTD